MSSPLPCPFCGHVGVTVRQTDTHKWRAAVCDNCGAQSCDVRWIYDEDDPDAKCEKRAIEEWNTRVTCKEPNDYCPYYQAGTLP